MAINLRAAIESGGASKKEAPEAAGGIPAMQVRGRWAEKSFFAERGRTDESGGGGRGSMQTHGQMTKD